MCVVCCFAVMVSPRSRIGVVLGPISVLARCEDPVAGGNEFTAEVEKLAIEHSGEVSVAVKNLVTGETFLHQADRVMPTASLIKFPILIELYRQFESGKLSPERALPLRASDKVPGSGVLTEHFAEGTQLPLLTAARLMITFSDNTATNLVLEQVGIPAVNASMAALGAVETRVNSRVYRRDESVAPERSQQYGLGSTTAKEMLFLLEQLHARQVASKEGCDEMLKHLATCDDRTKLLRFLPKTVKAYHKTGAVANVRTDAGLFETNSGMVAVVVLTAKNKDASWGDENAAEVLCGKIGKLVYDHYLSVDAPRESDRELRQGATGELVEALQRTLNARLEPSPHLSIDGDFGSMTATAVRQFQRMHGLVENGVVNVETWDILGPLAFEESPVPPPSEINQVVLETKSSDPLEGIPFVSCRAWVVAKGDGEVIGGSHHEERLDMASTTKIMTAWLVIKACQLQPSRFQERIKFSSRADQTPGSSATVRAGESLTVEECLYGLLLPSGNDAAVALAEHFGKRDDLDPLTQFVSEMNREAERLGMSSTRFVNPHGLTAPEHGSSCVDLVRLSREAFTSPRFRQLVSTRQFGCTLIGEGGYQRHVVWKNTNQLLGIDGYLGVKTGTTDAAGACLVSVSIRPGRSLPENSENGREDELFVVVLGSSGSAARYADSRNLHRWGWTR